jgi:hypothetical protein
LWPGFWLLLPVAAILGQSYPGEGVEGREPIHVADLDDQAVAISRMYLAEDYMPVRGALRKLQDSCREMTVEERETYSAVVVDFDRSLHRALDRTRELAADGAWDDSEKQYTWVLRTCTGCHRATRELGVGPAIPLP